MLDQRGRQTSPSLRLEACLADENDVSEYRFLVNNSNVKYITLDPGIVPAEDLTFEPVLVTILPKFPPGDWNEGHVGKGSKTGLPVFTKVSNNVLRGVKPYNIWYERKVEHTQLKCIDRVRQNIWLVTCELFEGPILYKFAEFPWQTGQIEQETIAYRHIEGQGIGPRFHGHVAEAGRVMGFLMEFVEGRTAEIQNEIECQKTLEKLHALGLKHGDVNKYNFLINEATGGAVLVDFETTLKCTAKQELADELASLRDELLSTDGRGGVGEAEIIA